MYILLQRYPVCTTFCIWSIGCRLIESPSRTYKRLFREVGLVIGSLGSGACKISRTVSSLLQTSSNPPSETTHGKRQAGK